MSKNSGNARNFLGRFLGNKEQSVHSASSLQVSDGQHTASSNDNTLPLLSPGGTLRSESHNSEGEISPDSHTLSPPSPNKGIIRSESSPTSPKQVQYKVSLQAIQEEDHNHPDIEAHASSVPTSPIGDFRAAEVGKQFSRDSVDSVEGHPVPLIRPYSRESTGENIMSTKECLEQLNQAWFHLRAKLAIDHAKYSKQMLLLDYVHSCEQAKVFLEHDNNDDAWKYCNAAKTLVSNHWYVYNVRASIWKATGEYDKAQDEMRLMRKYMQNNNGQETPESLAIYYGLKIDNMLAKGDVGDAKKQYDKVVKLIKKYGESDASGGSDNTTNVIGSLDPIRFTIDSNMSTRSSKWGNLLKKLPAKEVKDGAIKDSISKTISERIAAEVNAVMAEKLKDVTHKIDDLNNSVEANFSRIDTVASDLNLVQQQVDQIRSYLDNLDRVLTQYQLKIDEMLIAHHDDKILKAQLNTISKNLVLKEYFKAFILTFTQAYTTAQVVLKGDLNLSTGGIVETLAVNTLGFIPFCGSALSTIAENGIQIIEERILRQNAALVIRIAESHEVLYEIIKIVAKDITLHPQKQNELRNPPPEEKATGLFGKLFSKIKSVKVTVEKVIDGGEIYKTPYAQKGFENASDGLSKLVEQIKEKNHDKPVETFFDPADIMRWLKCAIIRESEWAQPEVLEPKLEFIHPAYDIPRLIGDYSCETEV